MSATPTDRTPPDASQAGPRLVLPSRKVPAGNGWDWIVRGWRLFVRAPLMWILSLLILFVAAVVMNFIPVIGGLVFQVLNAAIFAGFVVACSSLERGGVFELEHLFAGFRTNFVGLLVVGLLYLAGEILIFVVFAAFAGFPLLSALMSGDEQQIASQIMGSIMVILLGFLVALALLVPLVAAFWFAPALVVMHNMGPVEAMKQSFVGCFRNFVPFLVYGFIMLVFALLTFGIGMIVWIPLAIASTYAAYRDIYTEDAPAAAA